MKSIFQIALLLLVFIFSALFYFKYFPKIEEKETNNINKDIFSNGKFKENTIQNLKYEVNLGGNKKYIIISDYSEIINVNDDSLISMKNVIGKMIDKNDVTLTIKSKNALYDNLSYNSIFKGNVIIEYLKNKINADQAEVNFTKNFIKIYGNVKYNGPMGYVNTDIIQIDLMKKKINMYMNDTDDNLRIETK